MAKHVDSVDRMRIASPCSVGWENMSGDERVRFCRECNLHVYNISEMTSLEVQSLIANTEGRICAKLYRRDDGTVLTKDCPVGLRAIRRRASRIAGAALTALLSLCTVAVGQSKKEQDKSCTVVGGQIKREAAKDKRTFAGVVTDVTGAVVSGAEVILVNEETKEKIGVTTSDEGAFKFPPMPVGKYTLKIDVMGFMPYTVAGLELKQDEVVTIEAVLRANTATSTVLVGIVTLEPMTNEDGSRTISGDVLRKLPIN